ncbi:MAG: MmgE/PrpD family protein, partial [Oligoflexia bacterium]|nr:MmgE/PrpD family protein [Oligoflexia bacterium]
EDGSARDKGVVEYPLGHRRRREEGVPLLIEKFKKNLARRFPQKQQQKILEVTLSQEKLHNISVCDYLDHYVI